MSSLLKITPNLWFDHQAEEAAAFYTSIFKNSTIKRTTRYGKAGFNKHGKTAGTVMSVEFSIEGQTLIALNGGPRFKFNESVSFIVNCDSQDEINYYWSRLSEDTDPDAQKCGWIKDKYGLSWQIVPAVLHDMIRDPDSIKTQNVINELFKMSKIDIATLKEAYDSAV